MQVIQAASRDWLGFKFGHTGYTRAASRRLSEARGLRWREYGLLVKKGGYLPE
jgi:hypothetical protein